MANVRYSISWPSDSGQSSRRKSRHLRYKQNGAQRTASVEHTTERRNKFIIPIKGMELPDESHLPKGETDSSPALPARAEAGQDLKLMDKATEMEIPSSLPPLYIKLKYSKNEEASTYFTEITKGINELSCAMRRRQKQKVLFRNPLLSAAASFYLRRRRLTSAP